MLTEKELYYMRKNEEFNVIDVLLRFYMNKVKFVVKGEVDNA